MARLVAWFVLISLSFFSCSKEPSLAPPEGGVGYVSSLQPSLAEPASKAATAAEDRAALVALYHSTGGDNWRRNDNWLSDAPLGQWYGVDTSAQGRVVALRLSYNQLSGGNTTSVGQPF